MNKPTDTDNASLSNSNGNNVNTTNNQPTLTLRRGRSKGNINVTSEAPTNSNSENNNAVAANSIATNDDTTYTQPTEQRQDQCNDRSPTNINSKINNAADSIGINENTTNAQPTITLRRGRSKGKINITNEATTNSNSEVLSTEITANISTGHRAKRKFRDIPSDSDNDNEKKVKKFGSKKARGITNIITEHLSTERNAASNEESSDVKRKEKVFDISENTALRKRKANENENDLAIDEGKKKAAKSENGS
ncbi:hypothetical protein Glove_232g115 [Diversispora epigaea]|uniref:Uncharacterized protein n=1 Tax=Diversispora epigaea TaxID=1348612 RepID=A0A397IGA9_9GLOM|nr:hypothetical protein Glove_232g115 [Diversispora epigaea]